MSLYIGRTKIGKLLVGTQSADGGINTDDATLTSGAQMLSPYTSYSKGEKYTGTIPTRTDANLTASGNTVTVAPGYYAEATSKSIATANLASPTISVDANGLITASVSQTAGYVATSQSSNTRQLSTQGTKQITPGDSVQTAVQAGLFTTGNVTVAAVNADETTITSNGTYTPANGAYFNSVVVNVPTGSAYTTQAKSVDPTESRIVVQPDANYDALSSVTVNPISSTYIGSEIDVDPSPSVNANVVTIPEGYYSDATTATVPATTQATPSISVSNTGLITASAVQSAGYVTSGTKTATEQLATKAAETITPSSMQQTAVAAHVYTTGAVTVAAVPTETKTVTTNGTYTPTTGSYFSSVTVNVSGDSFDTQSKSVDPTESEIVVTPDQGYDGLSSVTVTAIDSEYVGSDIARNSSSSLTASGATVTAPAGYYAESVSKTIASGTSATPATTITANPTIGVSATGLITATASASQNITPTVSAGYVSSGTAGKITVSGSNTQQLTTQAAKTVTPTETEQVAVAANTYTTGQVKVGAISSTYVGSDITRRDNSDLSVSGATVTVPAGYYEDTETKAVSTTTHSNPTASINSTTGLVTASHTQTAGYVSAGTTTWTLQLTAKAAATYNTSTTDQTIAAGQYLTGAQTIKAVTVSGLSAENIVSGVTVKVGDANDDDRIASVTGSLVIQHYYTGSSAPSASTGSDGDIYLMTGV